MFLLKTFKALNGLLCADVPLRNYSLNQEPNSAAKLLGERLLADISTLKVEQSAMHSAICDAVSFVPLQPGPRALLGRLKKNNSPWSKVRCIGRSPLSWRGLNQLPAGSTHNQSRPLG